MVLLKDEPEMSPAVLVESAIRQGGQVYPGDFNRSALATQQSSNQVNQGSLAAARLAQD
jgi:hypothetical protein